MSQVGVAPISLQREILSERSVLPHAAQRVTTPVAKNETKEEEEELGQACVSVEQKVQSQKV